MSFIHSKWLKIENNYKLMISLRTIAKFFFMRFAQHNFSNKMLNFTLLSPLKKAKKNYYHKKWRNVCNKCHNTVKMMPFRDKTDVWDEFITLIKKICRIKMEDSKNNCHGNEKMY